MNMDTETVNSVRIDSLAIAEDTVSHPVRESGIQQSCVVFLPPTPSSSASALGRQEDGKQDHEDQEND